MPNCIWIFGGPGGRSAISEVVQWRIGETWQDVGEVIAHRDLQAATAFDHREDSRYPRSGVLTPDMDPIASADGYSPDILPMSVRN